MRYRRQRKALRQRRQPDNEYKATFVEAETAPQKFEKRVIKTGLSDGINIEVVSGCRGEDQTSLQRNWFTLPRIHVI
jgi:HlyD family secretion protein